MSEYFHHQIIRNHVIAFGDLFRDIHIKRWNGHEELNSIHVPISYSNKEAFIERVRLRGNDPDNVHDVVSMTVPRLAFEITDLQYDPTTKLNRLHKFRLFHDVSLLDESLELLGDISMDQVEEFTKNRLSSLYTPVPYLLNFSLYFICNREDDRHHIMELLPPQFTPNLYTTVNYVFGPVLIDTGLKYKGSVRAKLDESVTLDRITSQDLNDANFQDVNLMIVQFDFTMRCHFFREIASDPIIKKYIITYNTSLIGAQTPVFTDYVFSAPENAPIDLDRWYNYFYNDMWQDTDDVNPSTLLP